MSQVINIAEIAIITILHIIHLNENLTATILQHYFKTMKKKE